MNTKSLLYLNKLISFLKKRKLLVKLFLFLICAGKSQPIANYINNGGFEDKFNCVVPQINTVKYWRTIDSAVNSCAFLSTCFPNVPYDGNSYQFPKSGQNYVGATFLCQPPGCPANSNRGYFRNRLKANLQPSKVYCVKFYINIRDNSTYAIDRISAFFVDNSIDTITQTGVPLTFINPQINNPVNNIITDTMNWVLITGMFVANGTEKNCVIGNFKSDSNTNKILINPTNLPTIGCDILLDDVSCIPLDLPAFAGPDVWAIPGTTIYIGRPQDVGIDEACLWYKLPNTTSVIANAAGFSLTVSASTETYMVKQNICGVIKYDTVVVHQSGVGFKSQNLLSQNLKVYPNPAQNNITIECSILKEDKNLTVSVFNNIGQLLREEEIIFKDNSVQIKTDMLCSGVYFLSIKTKENYLIHKKFIISR